MGALPKRRISTHRRGRRRQHHQAIKPTLVACPHCGKPRRPHYQCPHCGN